MESIGTNFFLALVLLYINKNLSFGRAIKIHVKPISQVLITKNMIDAYEQDEVTKLSSYFEAAPSSPLYFMLGNNSYSSGDSVNISDIGQQPHNRSDPGLTLVCITSKVNKLCCRNSDNEKNSTYGGAVGEYLYPNGSIIIRGINLEGRSNVFARYGYAQQIRLGRVGIPAEPVGNYSCVVPKESNGENVTARIRIYSNFQDEKKQVTPTNKTIYSTTEMTAYSVATPTDRKIHSSTTETMASMSTPTNGTNYSNTEFSMFTLPSTTITTPVLPLVTVTTTTNTIEVNASFSIYCKSSILGRFDWSHSGVPLSELSTTVTSTNGTHSVLVISSAHTSHAGQYTCTVTTDDGKHYLEHITIIVQLLPPFITTKNMVSATQGTVFNLVANVKISLTLINTPVIFESQWIRHDSRSNVKTLLSDLTLQQLHSSMLKFSPLRNQATNGGTYNYTVTVKAINATFILSSSAHSLVTLTVNEYPKLNITRNITSGECQVSRGITLSGKISLLNNTYFNKTVTFKWTKKDQILKLDRNDNEQSSLVIMPSSRTVFNIYTLEVCLTISKGLIQDHCSSTSYDIITIRPGEVKSMNCTAINNSALSVTWNRPVNYRVFSYEITVKKYIQDDATRLVTKADLIPPYKISIKSHQRPFVRIIEGLVEFVPYFVSVETLNSARCGSTVILTCFTREGVPSKRPTNVRLSRDKDDRSILKVTWNPLTIVEARGFITYVIIATAVRSSANLPELLTRVPGNMSSARLYNADQEHLYQVNVTPYSSNGEIGLSTLVSEDHPLVLIIVMTFGVTLSVFTLFITLSSMLCYFYCHGEFKANLRKFFVKPLKSSKRSEVISNLNLVAENSTNFDRISNKTNSSKLTKTENETKTPSKDSVTLSLKDFKNYVELKNSKGGFEEQFESFKSIPSSQHCEAEYSYNTAKNRYTNIYPYDFSRVVLSAIPDVTGSDFINASLIDGYNKSACYIAAQGPLSNTEADFWRMIWEQNVSNIVMLTKCLEAGKRKCEQYWVDSVGKEYRTFDGMFVITTMSITSHDHYTVRKFSVQHRSVPDRMQAISQFHFTSWPDHGVPKFATPLLSFIKHVQREHDKDLGMPLLVHCSAGVGRTGTFITLDAMLERMKYEQSVNVYDFVKNMRKRRVSMVQTIAQYKFIHYALDEYITSEDSKTILPMNVDEQPMDINSSNAVPGLKEQIFEQLDLEVSDAGKEFPVELSPVGTDFYADILPDILPSKVFLNSSSVERLC